jgi:tol-pal system protein YbgF
VLTGRPVALLALLLTVAGCATQADIQDVMREQRRVSGALADTRASLEAMQRDLAKLRGRIDEVRHARGRTRADDDRLEALETRVAALEGGRAATPPEAPVAGESAPAEGTADVLAREEAGEAPDEYRQGLARYREGGYDRAIQAFRGFLRTNQNSPLAANAHYWIGDSYYMLGDYYQAILNFNDVRQHFASSDRAPAAVLKIGLAFLKMGNKSEARVAFQKVIQDYPSSPEAGQAREQLRALDT